MSDIVVTARTEVYHVSHENCPENSPDESLVPTLDDLSRAQREGEGVAAGDARVELAAVLLQGALKT